MIVDLLFQKDSGRLGYVQLYNSVKGVLKKLSYETYDIHLRNLRENALLDKTGKDYCLSYKAYFLHRLKILDFSRPGRTFLEFTMPEEENDIEKRLKMYLILSYYARSNYFYRLRSREQFEEFLSRYQLCEKDLRIYKEYDMVNRITRID